MRIRALPLALLGSLLAGCGGGTTVGGDELPPAPSLSSDVTLSWDHARVYLPFAATPTTVGQLASVAPSPVAIFLHGCTGLDPPALIGTDQDWGAFLARQGYLVIMPDSMARPSRHGALTCDPATFQRGMNLWIYDLRTEEANLALRKALLAPWYGGQRLILGGHSEGAAAVYRTTYAGPTDLIMSGFWCTAALTRARPRQAVFYLNWSKDPWYYTGGDPFDGSRCLVPGYDITSITVAGAIHDGLTDPVAAQAAADFVATPNQTPEIP